LIWISTVSSEKRYLFFSWCYFGEARLNRVMSTNLTGLSWRFSTAQKSEPKKSSKREHLKDSRADTVSKVQGSKVRGSGHRLVNFFICYRFNNTEHG
jgi:hypothetical protein